MRGEVWCKVLTRIDSIIAVSYILRSDIQTLVQLKVPRFMH